MKYFLVEGTHTDNIPTGDEFLKILKEHQAYMSKFEEEGKLLLAGIKSAGGGGFVIIKCEDIEEAKAIDAGDPFAVYGLQTSKITEFDKVFAPEGTASWFD